MCGHITAGTALPKGKAAIGWRVAVYWRDDKAFYAAEVVGFDTATGRHEVEYDDGELPDDIPAWCMELAEAGSEGAFALCLVMGCSIDCDGSSKAIYWPFSDALLLQRS